MQSATKTLFFFLLLFVWFLPKTMKVFRGELLLFWGCLFLIVFLAKHIFCWLLLFLDILSDFTLFCGFIVVIIHFFGRIKHMHTHTHTNSISLKNGVQSWRLTLVRIVFVFRYTPHLCLSGSCFSRIYSHVNDMTSRKTLLNVRENRRLLVFP